MSFSTSCRSKVVCLQFNQNILADNLNPWVNKLKLQHIEVVKTILTVAPTKSVKVEVFEGRFSDCLDPFQSEVLLLNIDLP